MGENQKIHPVVVEVEAPPGPPPTTPLVPSGSVMSHKFSPSQRHRQPSTVIPPLAVVTQSKPSKSRSCCCKLLCCSLAILLLLPLLAAVIIYFAFHPRIPNYSVDSLRISDLRLNWDATLYAEFNVRITASNPNKKIGIYYEKGGLVSVWYRNTKLCEGSIPKFFQGHQNITKLEVSLSGQTQYGNTLMTALQEQQQTGRIPLDLKVHAPVAIKLGRLKLRKVKIHGDCSLVVDSLSTNNKITIKASNCKYGVKL